jgi:formate dehydrogenase accessory protein FdhD
MTAAAAEPIDPAEAMPPPAEVALARVLAADGTAEEVAVAIAAEVPVALVYNGIGHAVMMATPADLEDFALGFSLSEGIVGAAREVRALDVVPVAGGVEARLAIAPRRLAALKERRRALAGRTGCGLCGVDTIAQAVRPPRAVGPGPAIARAAIDRALDALRAHQPLNAEIHALHAAAWAGPDGTIRLAREDVGRHNALDKLIGALARAGADTTGGFALITSR